MSIATMRDFLLWCTIINFGLLLVWASAFMSCHDWMHRLHARWFRLSVEQFDALNWAGMVCYKLAIYFFNLVPFVALWMVG